MSPLDAYRQDPRKMQHLIEVTKAVLARLPKKYEWHLVTLLKHFPDACETYTVAIPAAHLGLLWRCDPAEVPRLLKLMTVRSGGVMTYRIGDSQLCLGATIQIQFAIDNPGGPTHG